MATIRDVCKLAGVSVATVSRVLNNSGYVKEETRDAIVQAMKALHYTPNTMARGLAGKSTSTVALIVPDILNPYFPELARAIEDVANQFGFNVILCNSDHDAGKEAAYIELLRSKKVDGMVIASYTIEPGHILRLIRDRIPVVAIDRIFGNDPILSCICKNKEGARMAVRHLLERGCRKIAHIAGPPSAQSAVDRMLGFEEQCLAEGLFFPSLIQTGHFRVEDGFRAMQSLLQSHPDVDGVFAANDLMAVGALKAIWRSGRRVPEDVKVIGFDDIPLAASMIPELSSVKQPIYEMGAKAMRSLIEMVKGNPVECSTIQFDVEVMCRETTAASQARGDQHEG